VKAIRIDRHGGSEALQVVDLPLPGVPAGHALVRNMAIGVNYVDVQHRQGGYYPVQLPLIPGIEAAGIVERIGGDVTLFQPGQRVAYAGYMGGNYAEYTLVPESQLVPVPEGVDLETATAGLLQGMTAHCLTHDVYPVHPGDFVLIHAAAGGVGSMLVQLAKQCGARVIGTVSTQEKAAFARSIGVDYVIRYRENDFLEETMAFTGGEGVHVVYDANGKSTFDQSLAALRRRGYMVVYGQTSGAVPPFDINRLSGITDTSTRGAIFLTWAALSHYNTTYEELLTRANAVFQLMQDGRLKVHIDHRLKLEEAAEAHRLLERRATIGKIVLIP
jgi:NADPH:quinone reductase